MTECYTTLLGGEIFQHARKVTALVTRYGIDEAQNEQNYRLLRGSIRATLQPGASYAVSFDFTHSFRSMPLFNLISFEYLKSVLPDELTMEHIYYGALNLVPDQPKLALILDYAMVGQVLSMTHAVQEFKSTGRPISLIRLLKEQDPSLSHALEAFDWATQSNDFGQIDESVDSLLKLVQQEAESSGIYSDVRSMVADVLRTDLLQAPDGVKDLALYWRRIDDDVVNRGSKHLHLCKWHIRMERHGLASVIAQEALRSMLVPLVLDDGIQPNEQNCSNRYNREASERLLWDFYPHGPSLSSEAKFLSNLQIREKENRPVRNRYAHML